MGARMMTNDQRLTTTSFRKCGMKRIARAVIVVVPLLGALGDLSAEARGASRRAKADDSERLLTIDHFVKVQSTVPAIAGQPAQIYVRERVEAGAALRGSVGSNRVLLFVHGAGTPAEVSFDVPYQDYSWMAYLA